MPNLRRLPSAPREIRRARRGEFQDVPKAQKRGFGRRQPAFRFGRKVGFFRSAQFFRRRNASRPKFDMAAQRVRSGEIKSCRCKSQVLQGYYNSENFFATAAGLFAGRFPTLKYRSRRRRCARLAQLPHASARAQSQSLARRGASIFLRNEYFAIEEKRKWRAKPASPRVMSPIFIVRV